MAKRADKLRFTMQMFTKMNFKWDYSLRCKPNGQRPKQYIAEAAHDQEVCRLRDVENDGLTTDNLKGAFKGAH